MDHRAKKSLGQNFLKSEPALRMMCSAGNLSSNDLVLEIGPGKGALTSKLLEVAKCVIAVEKDNDLVLYLQDKFKNEIKDKKLILLNEDIMNFDPKVHDLKENKYKIIANIPYNITGGIIRYFLSETVRPSVMVLLVQKEVAERIVARDGKESILSLSVKAYGDPIYIMKVHKRFFSPAPKVDSAILAINNINSRNFKGIYEEKRFFEVIKSGFAHKRKVLKKNLEAAAHKDTIYSMFNESSIPEKARAEDIDFPKWLKISKYLGK